MKRCKFCEHHAYNDHDEEVCLKYLVYVGDDTELDTTCEDFTIDTNMALGVIVLAVSVGLLFLLTALI